VEASILSLESSAAMITATDPPVDKRIKILDATIRKKQASPDALITVLHKAQELYGFLDLPILWHVARALRLPPSRVHGVATFYHLFRMKPQGEHTCVICLGTACFVKGGQKLLESVQENYQIQAGHTSQDGKISLSVARCIGACGIAPAVVIDDQCLGQMDAQRLNELIQEAVDGP
jgi:bidirectional [NiFe] hydrogenase diaphorase subunit